MDQVPAGYFLGADDELVDFLEKQGEESIKETYRSNAINIENGYKLLNIQIVGIGSSFLLLTQKTNLDYLTIGLAVFTFSWIWCAIYLVYSGLSVKKKALIYSPPDHLYTDAYKNIKKDNYKMFNELGYAGPEKVLPIIRRYHLSDLCETSRELIALNKRLRNIIDRARVLTILAPLAALVASAITVCFS